MVARWTPRSPALVRGKGAEARPSTGAAAMKERCAERVDDTLIGATGSLVCFFGWLM